ncbi:hypothetical protein [Arthrobacter sp. B0490]|uniref:hypothetical protein n=1 Tax=Arthrobacter sp. B0490 TaxID=2058891 RepID=UPI000CE56D38|nr:hypothetical protein [Arthrobacter sp. B0490]
MAVRTRSPRRTIVLAVAAVALLLAGTTAIVATQGKSKYPWHTDIVSTTFWVGEIHDPDAEDGSQEFSTYDSRWMESYGGCDGIRTADGCSTEPRVASNGYFPSSMTPLQNPFYLDLPFDDLNNPEAFAQRGTVIPWAAEEAADNPALLTSRQHSFMKNRWVKLRKGSAVCYGQIQDAGPAVYDDSAYVFGTDDRRPASTEYSGAGLDVSPAINGCLGFSDLDGQDDRVDWQFVDEEDVPDGPWRRIVTTSQVQ